MLLLLAFNSKSILHYQTHTEILWLSPYTNIKTLTMFIFSHWLKFSCVKYHLISFFYWKHEGKTFICITSSMWNEITWAPVIEGQFSFLDRLLSDRWSISLHLYALSLWLCLKNVTAGFLQFIFSISVEPPKVYYFPSHFLSSAFFYSA